MQVPAPDYLRFDRQNWPVCTNSQRAVMGQIRVIFE